MVINKMNFLKKKQIFEKDRQANHLCNLRGHLTPEICLTDSDGLVSVIKLKGIFRSLYPTNKIDTAVTILTPVPAKNNHILSMPMLSIKAVPDPIPIEANSNIRPNCCKVIPEP